MQTANLRRVWRRVYDAAGVPANERVRPHDLRRSAGTKLTAALGIDAASAQLGDTREITERHYVMPSFVGPVEAVFCQVLVGHVAGFFPASWLLHEGVGYSPGFALVA